MRVFYLTWGETPRMSGVYKSQIINLLSSFPDSVCVELICGLPIINSGLIRERNTFFNMLRQIRDHLSSANGTLFTIIPIFAFQTVIYPKKWSYFSLTFLSDFILFLYIKRKKPDILHCRGYHSTNLAIRLRDKYNLNYKVVFDPRGLFPEESVISMKCKIKSFGYKKLKQIESQNIIKSDIVLSVSDTMTEYFYSIGAKNVKTVYLSSSLSKQHNVNKVNYDNIKFCYAGALSFNTWHKPDMLLDLFEKLNTIFPNSTLNILTNSDHFLILKLIPQGLSDRVFIKSCSTPEEVLINLSTQDIGLMAYSIPKDNIQMKVASTVFAIKSVEYFVSGLPVIVNKFCGGAKSFIEKYDLGLSYNPINYSEINRDYIIEMVEKFYNSKDSIPLSLFTYEANIKRLLDVYYELSLC